MSSYTKRKLVIELSDAVGVSQRKTGCFLDKLAEIVYREAADNGITVPGICRVDVVHRKERRARNPLTGEALLIAAHDMVRVRHIKRLRDNVTPPDPNRVTVLPEPEEMREPQIDLAPPPAEGIPTAEAAPATPAAAEQFTPPVAAFAPSPEVEEIWVQPETAPPAAAYAEPEAAPPAAAYAESETPPVTGEQLISFRCKNPECRQEIEAPDDMAGSSDDCPACGAPIEIPYFSEPGTLHGPELPPESDEDNLTSRTIRIELPDDDDPFA